MDKETIFKIVKKYKNRIRLIQIFGIILIASVIAFVPIHIFYRALIALLLIAIAIILYNRTISRNINKILYNDCNPQLYYMVAKGINPHHNDIIKDIDVAYFIGDFAKAYSLCTHTMNIVPKKTKPYYLKTLCSIQFLSGNFDACKDTFNKLIESMNSAKYNDKLKCYYTSVPEFFLYFIDGNYDKALEQLKKCEGIPKAANTYLNLIKYYYGLTYYYSGKFDLAEQFFKDTASMCPDMYIAKSANQYLSENRIIKFPQIPLTATDNNFNISDKQSAKLKPKSIIVFLALIILIAALITHVINLNTGAIEDVITENDIQINEICKTFTIDNDYTICIFNTKDDDIGVSLLKNKENDIYKYCISYTGIDDMMIADNSEYYITASGTSPKIQFGITESNDNIPKDYQSISFTSCNKSYCFYYTVGEEKYHFANSSGIVIDN